MTRFSPPVGSLVFLGLLAAGCTVSDVTLIVEVKSDLVPGVEADGIRTELFDALPDPAQSAPPDRSTFVALEREAELDRGLRVMQLESLEPTPRYARVRVMLGEEVVVERLARFTLDSSRVVTLVLTRDCRSVRCAVPSTCQGGECVPPECTEETPEACGPPACAADADCEAPTAGCAEARCVTGLCLQVGLADRCEPEEACVPEEGCVSVGCTGTASVGRDGVLAEPRLYGGDDHDVLRVDTTEARCVFAFTVEGAGGGRGNHGSTNDSDADGGDGGSVVFEVVPGEAGHFELVVGGAGTGAIVDGYTLEDPGPGAGGGGSSQVVFVAIDGRRRVLAVAGGGGGGGWGERGSPGGGGRGECGGPSDEGSTGGCDGRTGTPHPMGEPGGDCPSDGVPPDPDPCGGPGGSGTFGAGGFGVGEGFGGDERGSSGSGGGGGGYGGGSAGGGQGDPGLGGGAYFDHAAARFVGGETGGAHNGARYADGLTLAGGDGRVVVTARAPE